MIISAEDVLEMSGVETLHPGGFDLSKRIGVVVNFTPSSHVLDVSSGKGVFACLYAREFGSRITGLEFNPRFIDLAKKRAQEEGVADKVEFKIGDSRKLPFLDNEFDVVVNECAIGLTAIKAPQRVLDEMVRVTKPGGTLVIHESTWLKNLSADEIQDASMRLGTTPYSVDEWKQMLVKAGAVPKTIEDWSGMDNAMKIRPNHKWNPDNPLDLFTTREKLVLIPRLIAKLGIASVFGLYRSSKKLHHYMTDGYLGYALIVASKE
jgi:ubiquinone/menaquinone biosynthesis C-methylase UbiE